MAISKAIIVLKKESFNLRAKDAAINEAKHKLEIKITKHDCRPTI